MTRHIALTLLLASLLSMAACAQPAGQKPVALTQTNEQGCTRQRSLGPQDPYADPAPLKEACIGPYLLALPQNYFYNQIGTEHDGSYMLALEYPSLQAFKPGERMNLTADMSIRTVSVEYRYIDRIDIREAMRRSYTPMAYQQGNPEASLESRIQGERLHGLVPYYLDMGVVRTHYRAQGFKEGAPVMTAGFHKDWFLAKDAAGEVETVIKCTPREITVSGVEYREGKLVKSKENGYAVCTQTFMIAPMKTLVEVTYPREGLERWREIDARARELLTGAIKQSRGVKK
ncbi:hypothetical protein [Stenotrophomonas sp.]|uniref:hypothetical protein n=1 Tax=Stenotrophomonas sp. TaxID=69392 RepID=UPI002FC76A30